MTIDALQGPARDTGLSRSFPVGGNQVQLRWEVFNMLNTVNLDNPVATMNNPTSARSPRLRQVPRRASCSWRSSTCSDGRNRQDARGQPLAGGSHPRRFPDPGARPISNAHARGVYAYIWSVRSPPPLPLDRIPVLSTILAAAPKLYQH
jgi:hypothetical protein